jgi:hypothetical protein
MLRSFSSDDRDTVAYHVVGATTANWRPEGGAALFGRLSRTEPVSARVRTWNRATDEERMI